MSRLTNFFIQTKHNPYFPLYKDGKFHKIPDRVSNTSPTVSLSNQSILDFDTMTEQNGDSYSIPRWQIYVEKLPERIEAHPGDNLLLFYMSNKRESNSSGFWILL